MTTGSLGSSGCVVDRLLDVPTRRRLREVVGELRQVALRVQFLQRLADLAVQADAARRAQLLVQRLADEGVREPVLVRRARQLGDHARAHRLFQRFQQPVALRPRSTFSSSRSPNSRPMTEPIVRTRLQSSERWSRRRPTTSRTLCGIVTLHVCDVARLARAGRRPPAAARSRSRRTGCLRSPGRRPATSESGGDVPAVTSMKRRTSCSVRPRSRTRWLRFSRFSSPSVWASGCWRRSSTSR